MRTTLLNNIQQQMFATLIPNERLIETEKFPKLFIGTCVFKSNIFMCKNALFSKAFKWLYLSKSEISIVITNPEDYIILKEAEKYEALYDVIKISARRFIVTQKKHLRLMLKLSKFIRLTMLAVAVWAVAACIGVYLR